MFSRLLVLLLACMVHMSAHAGVMCTPRPLAPEEQHKSLALALQTREALDASGAEVALVARVGQDVSRYGLHYSHLGFVWRDHPQGRWTVVHLLNDCGTAHSTLYDQGLGNFFGGTPLYAYDALIIIPSPAAQARLALALADPRIERLHEANYSMLAYPWATRYQNSNQWVLEMLNEGYQETAAANRQQAQAWLRQMGYTGTDLRIPGLLRTGADVFRASIAFDDHPAEQLWRDEVTTITVESIAAYLHAIDPQSRSTVARLQ